MNYGFIAEDNDGNEVAVKIGYRKDDPLRKAKEQFLEKDLLKRTFRLINNYEEKVCLEFIGHVRFILLRNSENFNKIVQDFQLQQKQDQDNPGYRTIKTPCISVEHETRTLQYINDLCVRNLAKYPQTYKEDMGLLLKGGLTDNQSNCVKLRSGEKEVGLSPP